MMQPVRRSTQPLTVPSPNAPEDEDESDLQNCLKCDLYEELTKVQKAIIADLELQLSEAQKHIRTYTVSDH